MEKIGEKISLVIMTTVYLLCSLRYFPDQPAATMTNTTLHLLTVAPFLIGTIMICSSLYRKTTGETISWPRMARIYLTLGIIVEFFLGLYNYLNINTAG
jgi:hypothetical protein